MLIIGHYPAGFLMLIYLQEIISYDRLTSSRPDTILVTPLPTKKPNCKPLLICTRCHAQDDPMEMYTELTSSMPVGRKHTLFIAVRIHM